MLARIARLAIAAPKRIIAAAALILVGAAIFGLPVAKSLSAGGFTDPASESVRATDVLTSKFNHNDLQLLVAVTADRGVHSAAASSAAAEVTSVLKSCPDVADVTSVCSAPPSATSDLTSRDGKTGIIIAGLRGSDAEFAKTARQLVDQLPKDRDDVIVRGGGALTFAEANEQSERDLVKMESIAIPLSFVALVWVFGGLFAAALPMAVGVFAILGFACRAARGHLLHRVMWVDLGLVRELVYADCDYATVQAAIEHLRPQATRGYALPCSLAEFPDVSCTSVLCVEDQMLDTEWAKRIARDRLGADLIELPGSHPPFLSRPSALANVLIEVADKVADK